MPVVELASASLQDNDYTEFASARSELESGEESDFSSTKGRMGLGIRPPSAKNVSAKIPTPHKTSQFMVKSVFTNFTESISQSSEEFQEGVQKTFSSIVNTFSRDAASVSSDSGYNRDGGASSSSSSKWSSDASSGSSGSSTSRGGVSWTDLVLPEGIRTRVSSLTSRSSSYLSHSTNSSLSTRSMSPRTGAENIAITVDSSGMVLQEVAESDDVASEGSWHETGSREISLLDTIGESSGEDDDDADDSSSSSGSESGSEAGEEAQAAERDYDDDSAEFNSDVGLGDLGAVMLQIGSCHFEPESVSQSFDDDYSYTSEMFPPLVKSFIGQSKENDGSHVDGLRLEASRSAIFQRRANNNKQSTNQQEQPSGITKLFVSSRNIAGLCLQLVLAHTCF